MDMMFNTEVIVKDMKGGKEDMTEKRFICCFSGGKDSTAMLIHLLKVMCE